MLVTREEIVRTFSEVALELETIGEHVHFRLLGREGSCLERFGTGYPATRQPVQSLRGVIP